MHTSTTHHNGNLSLVEPNQVNGMIQPAAPETLGHRVLELSSMLQTTLDVQAQMQLFYQAIHKDLQIEGMVYTLDEPQLEYECGAPATRRATYELKLTDQSIGSLAFFRDVPFTNREIKLIENLLCGLVYPLRNALSYLAAVRLASHDPLTGVQNRMAMDLAFKREIDLAQRQNSKLSVLILDADHFKRYNDNFGHAYGDAVLRALANTALATIRSTDLLFRFGGEEFVVLASHTDQAGATLLAERIRHAIENIDTIGGRDVELTVSIGLTEMMVNDTPESMFERCDQAMYEAKQAGRNRVTIA